MPTPEGMNGRPPEERSFWERKGTMIGAFLDEAMPLSDETPRDAYDGIDAERQMFAMRSGLTQMEPEDLERRWLESHDRLPYSQNES